MDAKFQVPPNPHTVAAACKILVDEENVSCRQNHNSTPLQTWRHGNVRGDSKVRERQVLLPVQNPQPQRRKVFLCTVKPRQTNT